MTESSPIKVKIEEAFFFGLSLCCGWRLAEALISLIADVLESLLG